MPGWRALASRYCCIMGVLGGGITSAESRVEGQAEQPARKTLGGARRSVHCPALGPRRRSLLAVAEDPAHQDAVALGAEADIVHVVAHEHEAPAAGALEVLHGGRVGHVAGVEAGALVADVDLEPVAEDP